MRIVFLLSMPRSGSTLLRLHLDRFEGAIALPETHFFVFKEKYAKYDLSKSEDRKFLSGKWTDLYSTRKFLIDHGALRERIAHDARQWQDIFLYTIEAYRKAVKPDLEAPLWIEKSPPHIFFQPAIRAMFPEARFIHLIRDPRSVIGSLKTMPWSTSNVYALARSWQRALDLVPSDDEKHFVKYEDLVREPENTFNSLANFLGMNTAYRETAQATGIQANPHPTVVKALKPISTEMIEKWRGQLSVQDSDLAIIQDVCSKGMARMGYVPAAVVKDRNYSINKFSGMLRFALMRVLGTRT